MTNTTPEAPATIVRRLVRATNQASLATRMAAPAADGVVMAGHPYASLVLLATAQDGAPLMLLSDLALHSRNLAADPEASLLIDGTAGLDEPLTGARATLVGRVAIADDPTLRARFLARHPSATDYAGFADFHLWRMTVQAAHLVAGFGRIHWLPASALATAQASALAAAEADILAHMNADHADAVALYATRLLGLPSGAWRLTGVDPEGCDLGLAGQSARLDFATRVEDADQARAELVRLARSARTLGA